MSERTCGNCRWWTKSESGVGVCVRNPPQFAVCDHSGIASSLWPKVSEHGHCGEWTAKEEAAKNVIEAESPDWVVKQDPIGCWKASVHGLPGRPMFFRDFEKAVAWCKEQTARKHRYEDWVAQNAELVRKSERLKEVGDPSPQPVAYCIQCEPGDPKVHSLSFDKASLERVVTRHGGKIVGMYLREQAS